VREVFVAGIGITSFTRLEYPLVEIAAYPGLMALRDCGLNKIDQLLCSQYGSRKSQPSNRISQRRCRQLESNPAGADMVSKTVRPRALPR
jgi:hypothetical protein